MFREPRQRSTRKQLEKDRLDPLKSHKPEPPVAGPGDCDLASDLQRALRGQGGVIDTEFGRFLGPGGLSSEILLSRHFQTSFSIRTFCLKIRCRNPVDKTDKTGAAVLKQRGSLEPSLQLEPLGDLGGTLGLLGTQC